MDSIPCILGITSDIFIVYASNMLAILGLRSMFTVLVGAMHHVRYLHTGLAVLLAFVGGKMLMPAIIPATVLSPPSQAMSLGFIFVTLLVTVLASVVANRKNQQQESACTTLVVRPATVNRRSKAVRQLLSITKRY